MMREADADCFPQERGHTAATIMMDARYADHENEISPYLIGCSIRVVVDVLVTFSCSDCPLSASFVLADEEQLDPCTRTQFQST
jgi:hypothetical protein